MKQERTTKNRILQVSKVQGSGDLKNRLMTVGFYGITGFLGWRFVLKPIIDKMRRDKEQNEVANDPNKQQATVMYNAMNTSGISWMRAFDQTNETELFEAARNINDWNAVQSTYKKLYSRNLLEDLQSELDTEELKTLMTILNNNAKPGSSGSSQTTVAKGYLIAAGQDIRIRSTPDSSVSSYSFSSNILGVIKQGCFIGYSSGETKVDNSGVIYIKVAIKFINTIPKSHLEVFEKLKNKAMTFWVGKGAITYHKYYKDMLAKYPSMAFDSKNISDMGLREGIK